MSEKLPVAELLSLALDHPDACYDPAKHLPKDQMITSYLKKLESKAEMLEDFFGIKLARGGEDAADEDMADDEEHKSSDESKNELCLITLPIVVKGIKPFPQELPMFMLRLAAEVDYSSEQKCIQNVAQELSFYYARYIDFLSLQSQAIKYGQQDQSSEEGVCQEIDDFKFALEHEILPEMKKHFIVRKKFALFDDLTFSMVTCTENLYKVFERC
jgi:DNA mismatch repair protein MLH1